MTEIQTNSSWFEVDKEGLKQLQAGKPKHYLVRELIQNAWDEDVKKVKLELEYSNGEAIIIVEDDSKEGFKDLKDSYTLYKETEKRKDPKKRGRFNLGEKQAFSICKKAIVETTTGTITFGDTGRISSNVSRKKGTKVTVFVNMTQKEFDEILEIIKIYLVPKNIKFYVNGQRYKYNKPIKTFTTSLATEISDNGVLRRTSRVTEIELIKQDKCYLYEMGIPVIEIECGYGINIKQKIPLSTDRETVSQSYLRDVFSEVLNNTFDDISEDDSSQSWIRNAMSDERISEEAASTIVEKRYGDKVCVADPFDTNSIDEAISHGYRVLRGNELSKEEWSTIRKFDLLESTSKLFGESTSSATSIAPTQKQLKVAEYAKKIAKRFINVDIKVTFINERAMITAQYGSNTLTFNVSKLGKKFFDNPVTVETTDLIVHELGHHAGNHTEHDYHELITKLAGQLTITALKEPDFFDI